MVEGRQEVVPHGAGSAAFISSCLLSFCFLPLGLDNFLKSQPLVAQKQGKMGLKSLLREWKQRHIRHGTYFPTQEATAPKPAFSDGSG